ncbi:N-acylneuraminate cytidylyltransferase [BD1-7 clade bacterium]|uniref:N-acylneuraminate cytidylyltransferase n=1 Tax=BD1-7 clade bacterium TaxID=2029982 RepID=A0A5S9QGW0_9GAMM|nr:N-acylneuraminate cytidylyltransferase [BD1-7 clade bacterium]CAA0117266.1 N-acylneuraminate cytidylyltransferase [BD1-7 clade bacterium]
MTKVIALMPLKANSTRVKGKNFRKLGNKPLFRWMLDKLLSMPEIDEVVINTDAIEELRREGLPKSDKLIVRQREKSICGDEVSMNRVIENDLAHTDADLYIMTHTTNPFLSVSTINTALNTLKSSPDKDSLFTVNKLQTRLYDAQATPVNHDLNNLIPTQDLAPLFEENSCLYIFTKQAFQTTKARIGKNPMMHATSAIESVDIDEPQDWDLAAIIAQADSLEVNV